MPYLGATFRHSPRIDLSKPPAPEISATLDSLRVCRSTKIFSQAMRSVCGVLNTHFLTGSTITTAPASEMNGTCACLDQRHRRHRGAGGRAADDDVDLVLLEQALGEGARLLGVAAVVVDDELQLAAEHAAVGVDALDVPSRASSARGRRGTTRGPVTERKAPMRIGSCANAPRLRRQASRPAARAARASLMNLMSVSCCYDAKAPNERLDFTP